MMTWLHKRLYTSKAPIYIYFSWYIFPRRMRIDIVVDVVVVFFSLAENTKPEEKANIKSINRVWNILGVFPKSHVIAH